MNRRPTVFWAPVTLVAGLAASACGGQYEPAKIESESHFLRYCEETCGGGFSCIDGVCTVGCVIGEETTCAEYADSAICTNESGEPGDVAICDVPCSTKVDCADIGPEHACYEGYCRAPAPTAGGSSASGVDPEVALARYPYVQPLDFPEGRDQLSCDVPRGLFDDDGSLRCQLVRAERPEEGTGMPDCLAPGRAPVSAELAYAVRAFMAGDSCEEAEGDCLDWPLCEFVQLPPDDLVDCQNSTQSSVDLRSGFCGIDTNATDGGGVPQDSPMFPIVEAQCGVDSRAIRLTGDHTVVDSTVSEIWMACEVEPN